MRQRIVTIPMWFPTLAAIVSVALGAGLGLLPGRNHRALGPIRTFGLTAAFAVVVAHLLPTSFHALGGVTFVLFAAGFAAPWLLGRVAKRRGERAGLELDFAGLVVHRLGDGLAMGAVAGGVHASHDHADVIIALGAHTIPVVAIVMLAFGGHSKWRSNLVRAALLALASVIGVMLGADVAPEFSERAEAWTAALVGGLLIHVVTHDLASHPPRTHSERTVDLLAGAVGISVPLVAGGGHHAMDPTQSAALERFWSALVGMSVDTAPLLLLGLLVGALLQSFGSRIPQRWLAPRTPLVDAVRGAVVGIPLPLCSCSVLPVSEALRRRRAGAGLVVAFLIATPELGAETFLLSIRFLGWPLAVVRLIGALGVAIVAGTVVARLAPGPGPDPELPQPDPHDDAAPGWRRVLSAFDGLLEHIGAWMVLGIVLAALVDALLPVGAIASAQGPVLELLVMSAVAVPSYVCAPSATPLAAVLIAKGVSPGAVLVGLLLGPATNVATLFFLRRSFGPRATLGLLAAVVTVSWGMALAVNTWLPASTAGSSVAIHSHSLTSWQGIGTAVFAIVLLRSIWRTGFRTWFSMLNHAYDHAHGRVESHGHGHGHGHGH